MIPTSGDENPYQPPKADIVVSTHSASRGAKPASSWILMAVFAFGAVAWWGRYLVYQKEFGVSALGMNASSLIALCCMFGLAALLLGPRQRWAYKLVVAIIAVHLGINLVSMLSAFSQHGAFTVLVITVPAIALRLWLFHCFTFGLPSRLYYGMAREDSPASETQSSES